MLFVVIQVCTFIRRKGKQGGTIIESLHLNLILSPPSPSLQPWFVAVTSSTSPSAHCRSYPLRGFFFSFYPFPLWEELVGARERLDAFYCQKLHLIGCQVFDSILLVVRQLQPPIRLHWRWRTRRQRSSWRRSRSLKPAKLSSSRKCWGSSCPILGRTSTPARGLTRYRRSGRGWLHLPGGGVAELGLKPGQLGSRVHHRSPTLRPCRGRAAALILRMRWTAVAVRQQLISPISSVWIFCSLWGNLSIYSISVVV